MNSIVRTLSVAVVATAALYAQPALALPTCAGMSLPDCDSDGDLGADVCVWDGGDNRFECDFDSTYAGFDELYAYSDGTDEVVFGEYDDNGTLRKFCCEFSQGGNELIRIRGFDGDDVLKAIDDANPHVYWWNREQRLLCGHERQFGRFLRG